MVLHAYLHIRNRQRPAVEYLRVVPSCEWILWKNKTKITANHMSTKIFDFLNFALS